MKLMPSTRGGALARFALGAFIVIGFTAATTAVAGLLQFKQLATYISATPALKHANVTIPSPGQAQTILLIGSDHRWGDPAKAANTDTMMLIRLDPNSRTINVLSIPRDLEVQIPRYGANKINAAFSVGGPNLLVRVLRQQVFPGLQVNHVAVTTFSGFDDLVNAIGCVYTDVDHRYYNNTALTDYASINIQPGYQKLCGSDALAFVRFRHTDSDIVRNARQQDFIRWAKQQYSQDQLISNRNKLVKIFGQHTQTDPDLHTTDGLINLFNLVAFMDGHTIKQIPFPAQLQNCGGPAPAGAQGTNAAQTPCYVTSDSAAEQRAFQQLMTPTVAQPAPATGAPAGHVGVRRRGHGAPLLSPAIAEGKVQATALHGSAMPVYYPRLIAAGSQYCSSLAGNCYTEVPSPRSYPRSYAIHDPSGRAYPAYRMTIEVNPLLGEYYGIQGMGWRKPPLLGGASFTRNVNGKELSLYTNGGKVSMVAWRAPWGVYWVSNTLTDTLSARQMIGIAASLTRA